MSNSEVRGLVREVKTQVMLLGSLIALMWIIEIVDVFVFRGGLDRFGIIPHTLIGLRGILFAPFLHGNFAHLIANTLPFAALGWLVMLRRTADFLEVSAIVMLIGGLGTWLIAPSGTIHIGASGVIFGYLGFLLSRGYFERRFGSILFSIIVGVMYGGLVWGILPGLPGISWQGHLFGFIGGIVAAKLLAEPKVSRRR
ncbi:MAG TPA: rhomboid family intramembrane serine protease [Trichocoleus sp.]|jgi:membrane associated rhomboid family serine protease